MKSFVIDELFKVSSHWKPELDDYVLYIDDFYENPDDIYDYMMNRNVPLWKYNPEDKLCRNGVDYIDARSIDRIGYPTRQYWADQNRLISIFRKHFHRGNYDYETLFEVNCFQTVKQFNTKYQHFPHVDDALDQPNDFSVLNFLVYLDKQEDGGTAIYEGDWLDNNEAQDLLYPVTDRFKIERIIPAKFNRAVIFPGNRLHGAYINDYHKYCDDNWRMTQVLFYHPEGKARYS